MFSVKIQLKTRPSPFFCQVIFLSDPVALCILPGWYIFQRDGKYTRKRGCAVK